VWLAIILAARDNNRPEYKEEFDMSNSKTVTVAGLVAAAALFVGSSAFAADSATPTAKQVETQCLKDAKAKGLTGDALKSAEKACKDAYAKATSKK
jgi:hypothetical protein